MPFLDKIIFRDTPPSAALEERARKLALKLDRFSGDITSCSIVVKRPHHHGRHGAVYEVHLRMGVRHGTLAISRSHRRRRSHQDAFVALNDAFHAMGRVVQDYERRKRESRSTGESLRHADDGELRPRGQGEATAEEAPTQVTGDSP